MAETLVELDRVSRHFGRVAAVDGVSLTIGRGEFFSLLGPSGCGKTTTLRLLAGFETPDADGGTIRIAGQLMNDRRPYERPVGMVFQHYALFPHLSVERNVAFGLEQRRRPAPEIRERVGRALEMVRLDPAAFGARMPAQLSGGQRQRVALARALVVEPATLLLDEPLGALDLKLRREMQLELKALNRELGTTFVYVTHDQQEALTMSDRIAVMDHGRVAQLGAPAEIYERPRTEFVAGFIGTSNIFAIETSGRPSERVAVRPERLALLAPGADPGSRMARDGTVREVVYLGEAVHVVVTLASSDQVTASVPNDGTSAIGWKRGDPIQIAWRSVDGQVLE